MNATFPTRPADLPETATLAALLAAHEVHRDVLVDAVHGIGDPLPEADLAAHAVAALAVQHALAERVLATRWCTARDALAYGAGVDAVAASMGLDPDELTMGLRLWADGQLRERLMSAPHHAEVLALVAGGADA